MFNLKRSTLVLMLGVFIVSGAVAAIFLRPSVVPQESSNISSILIRGVRVETGDEDDNGLVSKLRAMNVNWFSLSSGLR